MTQINEQIRHTDEAQSKARRRAQVGIAILAILALWLRNSRRQQHDLLWGTESQRDSQFRFSDVLIGGCIYLLSKV